MRRVLLAILVLGTLELASFGAVLAIGNVQLTMLPPPAPAPHDQPSSCVPYYMVDRYLCSGP
jgi:hypothetical protein